MNFHNSECDCINKCGDDLNLVDNPNIGCPQYQIRILSNDIVRLNFGKNLNEHYIGKAAAEMVNAYNQNATLIAALQQVQLKFNLLSVEQLACIWMGVNAKTGESINEGIYD